MDSTIVLFSLYIGYFMLAPNSNLLTNKVLLVSAVTIQVAHHLFAWHYGLYRKAWTYASIGELKSIFKAVTLTIIVVALVQLAVVQDIYFRALTIAWMLHILLIGGSRLSWRIMRDSFLQNKDDKAKRTMIIGAGQAGSMIVRQILQNPDCGMKPILFLDDDKKRQGLEMYGVKIAGGTENIPAFVEDNDIEKIIITIPSMGRQQMAELLKVCVDTGVRTQTIPKIEDLMTGKVSVTDMQDVKIEDLLGRDEVQLDMEAIANKLTGKTILITGAGGSIGSEICRQVNRFTPKKLVLLDNVKKLYL
ncbi:polysaccharide biosynthesis protein [Sporosarcina sp. SAFN-015]|uniref:nucleoside-diphosphate sugar epimerase/dehydratase n=1 Tax=Sporosarcina sp. SAFN-015 TaxID=3387274 RepID=UPI003F7D21B3